MAPMRASATTLLGGSVTLSVKIPGTFSGLLPDDPTAGRYLSKLAIWADNPIAGDYISSIALTDTDGVIPAPARGAFANYPTIVSFAEAGVADGAWLKSDGMVIEPPGGTLKLLPSGLYVTASLTTGALALGHVFRMNVLWGTYVPD